jgi:hypothetical protein
LINSGNDKRENLLLAAYSTFVILCADGVLGVDNWTIPTTSDIDNEINVGVWAFAKCSLPVICAQIRDEFPAFEEAITKLQSTSDRSLLDSLQKWRNVTLRDAWKRVQKRNAKRYIKRGN